MVYVREDTYMFRMFSRLLAEQTTAPPHAPSRAWSRPERPPPPVRGRFLCPREMPLVDIRSAAEADLALEENVDTLSLPYGPRLTPCAPTRDARLISSSERSTRHTVTKASFQGFPVFAMSVLCAPSLRMQPCSIRATRGSKRGGRAPRCVANDGRPEKPASAEKAPRGRRELMLNSSSLLVLGGLLDNALGGVVDNSRPSGLGLCQHSDQITLTACALTSRTAFPPRLISTTIRTTFLPGRTTLMRDAASETPRRKPRRWMSLLTRVTTPTDGFETTISDELDHYLHVVGSTRIPGLGSWTMLSSSSRLGTGVAWNTEPRDAWIRRRVRARRSGNASKRSASRCKRRGGRASVSKVSG